MVSNLAFDDRGGLVASCVGGGGGPTLFLIAPSTGMVTPIPPVPEIGVLAAFAMEQVTGNFALVTGGAALPGGTTYWAVPGGAATQLTFFQTGWWGLKSGIDVNPDPEKYGAGTPGGNVYSWSLTPNPGGLPTIGNGAFSLTLASSPGTAGGFHVASLARADFPLLGVRVLLDPAQIVLVQPIPAQPSVTLPLPIPSDVAVRGFRLCFQSFHADPQAPQGLAASAGVEVTVL
jgi:hypothetical protein